MYLQYFYVAVTGVISFGGLAIVLLCARLGFYSDVMMAIFFAGSVGAVVNNYFRLATIYGASTVDRKEVDRPAITIQIIVSPFLSGILAFVAYGLFLSGLLKGALFPEFIKLEDGYTGLTDMLGSVAPKSNLDTAKAIMWAFVAGFSERFIPNALSLMVERSKTGK